MAGGGDGGAVVTFTEGATVLGTVTAAAIGTWVYRPVLADGVHTVTASETDKAGNTGTAAVTFTLDTKAPAVTEALLHDTGKSAADRITKDATLTGSGDANALVILTEGAAVLGTTTASSSGAWTYVPSLSDGAHAIRASETDTAGNTGSSLLSFTLDTTAPITTLTSSGGLVSNPKQTIAGTGEAGTTITLLDGATTIGTPLVVGAGGTWSEGVTFTSLGAHPITAQDTDTAGNVGTSSSITFTYDHPPVITSGNGAPSATYVVNDKTAPLGIVTSSDQDAGDTPTYSLLDGSGHPVSSFGGFTIGASSGALAFTAPQATGTYNATAVATDSYGGTASQAIKVDVGSDTLLTGDVGDHGVTDTFVVNTTSSFFQIANFRVTDVGAGSTLDPHGVLAIDHTLFSGATAGQSGSSTTSLLTSHSAQIGNDTLILSDNNTVLDLQNVNRTAFLNHPNDVAFT